MNIPELPDYWSHYDKAERLAECMGYTASVLSSGLSVDELPYATLKELQDTASTECAILQSFEKEGTITPDQHAWLTQLEGLNWEVRP